MYAVYVYRESQPRPVEVRIKDEHIPVLPEVLWAMSELSHDIAHALGVPVAPVEFRPCWHASSTDTGPHRRFYFKIQVRCEDYHTLVSLCKHERFAAKHLPHGVGKSHEEVISNI